MLGNRGPSAGRITLAEDFRQIADQQRFDAIHISADRGRYIVFAGILVHRTSPL
jgi:hypothetical protein